MAEMSKVQRIAHWFGMTNLPRFSIDFPHDNYALIVGRAGTGRSNSDRIRLVIGTASHVGEGVGGTNVSMTLKQAEKLRDGLDRLLEGRENARSTRRLTPTPRSPRAGALATGTRSTTSSRTSASGSREMAQPDSSQERSHPAVRAYLNDWISVQEMESWLDREPFGRTPMVTDAAIFAERPDYLRALGGRPKGWTR